MRMLKNGSLELSVAVLLSSAGSVFASGFGVQTDLAGAVHYPDNSEFSIGNERQDGADRHSGHLTGAIFSQTDLSFSRQGVDFNGTTGNASFTGSAIAEMGRLRASGGATASSQSSGSAPFPHADGSLNFGGQPVAQFWDTVTFYRSNVAIGQSMQVTMFMNLGWSGGATTTPNSHGQAGATGIAGLDFIGNISAYEYRDSWGSVTDNPGGELVFSIRNGDSVGLMAQLTIFAACGVNGSTLDQVDAAASTDAMQSLSVGFRSLDSGLSVIGESGHIYLLPTPGAAVVLALGAMPLTRRRR